MHIQDAIHIVEGISAKGKDKEAEIRTGRALVLVPLSFLCPVLLRRSRFDPMNHIVSFGAVLP